MKQSLLLLLSAAAAGLLTTSLALAQDAASPDGNTSNSSFTQTNLVTDGGAGGGASVPAKFTDPQLLNPWGIAFLPGGPFWIADNGSNLSTLYDGQGNLLTPSKSGGGFSIPGGAPTGIVANAANNPQFGTFKIPNTNGTPGTSPALFIFAGEGGIISAWQPGDNKQAVVLVDNSKKKNVYKGLAMASNDKGLHLYVTDFRHGTIESYDRNFALVETFTDPNLPKGYAPFGIANIEGLLFVTLAKQDPEKEDDVKGSGHGFVDVFDTDGNLIRRFVSHGRLNSPWGVARAPVNFGAVGSDILIGNFGDGHINAYTNDGKFVTSLNQANGKPIQISGLWSLVFPTSVWGGVVPGAHPTRLYFTGGTDNEKGGLFGTIAPTVNAQ
jgi:uncharacterized protein (TIGR03118 family)